MKYNYFLFYLDAFHENQFLERNWVSDNCL